MTDYAHVEAFCHMLYRTDDGRVQEWIWNSRDGVTPFVISIEGRQASHVEWNRDRRDPFYVPMVGERIFVDLTEERAKEIAARKCDLFWDHPEYPAHDRFESKETFIDLLLTDMIGMGAEGVPDLIVVDEELHAHFRGRNPMRAVFDSLSPARRSPSRFA